MVNMRPVNETTQAQERRLVAANVRKYRRRAGLTQRELAERLGRRSDATIVRVESGDYDSRPSTLRRIALGLGVTLGQLYEEAAHADDDRAA